jgi:pyruvate-formate lyase
VMGALPCGREARIALTDGSVSAMPGSDTNGPTALANSAALAQDAAAFTATHLNMKFHPSSLEGGAGTRNLLALIKGFMDKGGSHVQFNCVDTETLKDAQVEPEKHRDLVIRVAGFSAYFTCLDKGVQDEIVKRTELTLR